MAGIAACVLLLHAGLLAGLPEIKAADSGPTAVRPLVMRQLSMVPAAMAAPAPETEGVLPKPAVPRAQPMVHAPGRPPGSAPADTAPRQPAIAGVAVREGMGDGARRPRRADDRDRPGANDGRRSLDHHRHVRDGASGVSTGDTADSADSAINADSTDSTDSTVTADAAVTAGSAIQPGVTIVTPGAGAMVSGDAGSLAGADPLVGALPAPAPPLVTATDPGPEHAGLAAAALPSMSNVAAAPRARPTAAAPPPDGTRPAAADGDDGAVPPVYPTKVPPAASYDYELRRGVLVGAGRLRWQPRRDGYELSIEGEVFGLPVMTWSSRGSFDRAGLAPLRFLDSRRARSARAANFRRDSGRITYSGTTDEHPLLPGGQDRLSFLLQLAAIVEAGPARYGPGAQIAMQVSGARGDAAVWTFAVTGREAVDLVGGGHVANALVVRRNPRRDHDTRAEVWLDPSRHHLPARLRLTSVPDGEVLEFTLRAKP